MAVGWSEWVRESIAFVAFASRPVAAVGAIGLGTTVDKVGVCCWISV